MRIKPEGIHIPALLYTETPSERSLYALQEAREAEREAEVDHKQHHQV